MNCVPYVKVFHVSLTSERRQYTHAKAAVGENLGAKMAPFTFLAGGGGDKKTPFAYVQNLITRVAILSKKLYFCWTSLRLSWLHVDLLMASCGTWHNTLQ